LTSSFFGVFFRFSDEHAFEKPNDAAALTIMNMAAAACMSAFNDIAFAYGQSDEYRYYATKTLMHSPILMSVSFVFKPSCELFQRRSHKIVTTITSHFTAFYQFYWRDIMPATRPLQYPPSFDGRAVLYPTQPILRDYLSWRQADCKILFYS
jgi:tRNA(His) guanylyltransferase